MSLVLEWGQRQISGDCVHISSAGGPAAYQGRGALGLGGRRGPLVFQIIPWGGSSQVSKQSQGVKPSFLSEQVLHLVGRGPVLAAIYKCPPVSGAPKGVKSDITGLSVFTDAEVTCY